MRYTLNRLQWIALAWCALAGPTACDDDRPGVYTARAYQGEAKCLDPYTPIGLVDVGGLSAACDPTCLEVGPDLYVSTLCPPFPAKAIPILPSASPGCADALALLKANTTCDTE